MRFVAREDSDSHALQRININGTLWKSNCFIEWKVFQKGADIELELGTDRDVTCDPLRGKAADAADGEDGVSEGVEKIGEGGKGDGGIPPSVSRGEYGPLEL